MLVKGVWGGALPENCQQTTTAAQLQEAGPAM
jgi:hypothetical protein